jgi:predicted transcriptional regulator
LSNGHPVAILELSLVRLSATFCITGAKMNAISVKLPDALRARLASEAKRRNVTESIIVRESLEQALFANQAERGGLSCADLAGELVGSMRGPRDLSTNKKYLQESVLSQHARRHKRTR